LSAKLLTGLERGWLLPNCKAFYSNAADMTVEGQKFYPGELATPEQIVHLANEYKRAAEKLLESGRRSQPLSYAPFRLAAIHAIELYLNSVLLKSGTSSSTIRGMQHNLSVRAELILTGKLKLKQKTLLHLNTLSQSREYLLTRYDPNPIVKSELNRLLSTLNEVSNKATAFIQQTENATKTLEKIPT
jgi:hypothetical protein